MWLTYKYRIYPNKTQSHLLNEMLLDFGNLYNAALQQRVEAYTRRRVTLDFYDQTKELTAIRQEPSYARWSRTAEEFVLLKLHNSFTRFFKSQKKDKKVGYPRYKNSSQYKSALFEIGSGLSIRKDRKISIVGIHKRIKVRWHRELPRTPKTAVIFRKNKKWFVCFNLELDTTEAPSLQKGVGIDLGIQSIVTLSTGEKFINPKLEKEQHPHIRRLQRAVSRKKSASARQKKARHRVGIAIQKLKNKKHDNLHKISHKITNCYSKIAIEKLNMGGLTSGMLRKQIYEASWGSLIKMIVYKAEKAGGEVVFVNPRKTSQECPSCGAIKRKKLEERIHKCSCGCSMDRDVAAATIIYRRGLEARNEPSGAKPMECHG